MKIGFCVALVAAAGLVNVPGVRGFCQAASDHSATRPANESADLPPQPRGKSTVLGGEIRSVDPVRDEIQLKVYGQKPLKILFDDRTRIYRDGKRIATRDLGPVDHASIQTLLDGTDIYALSIHLLSQMPEGEYQGQVLSFDRDRNELSVTSPAFRETLRLLVPADTPIARVGQPGFASVQPGAGDLVRGALVQVKFDSNKAGRAVATQISVLAAPGSAFVLIGNVSALDMHTGMLQLVDAQDGKTYRISFRPSLLPASHDIHSGDHLIVTANFEGDAYEASAITIDNDRATLDGKSR